MGTYSEVRQLAEAARTLIQQIKDTEEQLTLLQKELNSIVSGSLVDAMGQEQLTSLTLEADGNQPALELNLGTSIHASIPQSWDEERRAKAFAALPDAIVKVTVTSFFDKGKRSKASQLAQELMAKGLNVKLDQNVHHATLTSWVRERFDHGEELPDLDTIGASIVPRVKISEAKD